MSEQAVVNTPNESENQTTEGADAQDELDTLLQEYEQETSTGEQSTTTEQPTEPTKAETQAPVSPDVQRILERETQNDIKDAASAIKEASGLKLPDRIFRGELHASVEGDPRALRLWQNRHNDPKGWGKFLNAVGKDLAKSMSDMPDPNASADRDAVESAVRNASTHQPTSEDEPDIGSMSDVDFAQYKSKLAREARRKK